MFQNINVSFAAEILDRIICCFMVQWQNNPSWLCCLCHFLLIVLYQWQIQGRETGTCLWGFCLLKCFVCNSGLSIQLYVLDYVAQGGGGGIEALYAYPFSNMV